MSKPNGNQRQVFCLYCGRILNMEQHNTWHQHDKESGNLQTTPWEDNLGCLIYCPSSHGNYLSDAEFLCFVTKRWQCIIALLKTWAVLYYWHEPWYYFIICERKPLENFIKISRMKTMLKIIVNLECSL